MKLKACRTHCRKLNWIKWKIGKLDEIKEEILSLPTNPKGALGTSLPSP